MAENNHHDVASLPATSKSPDLSDLPPLKESPSVANSADRRQSIEARAAPPNGEGRKQKRNLSAGPPAGGGKSKKIESETRSQSSGSTAGVSGGRKRKRRRRHRPHHNRRWKPYHKMTAAEKRELQVREEKRAEKTRAQQFAHGKPMAPYNTTQFLLEDREARQHEEGVEAVLAQARAVSRERTLSGTESLNSPQASWGSEAGSSRSDSFSYDEFEDAYESAQEARLEQLSKDDLVHKCVAMENQMDRISAEAATLRASVAALTQHNLRLTHQLRTAGILPRPASAPPGTQPAPRHRTRADTEIDPMAPFPHEFAVPNSLAQQAPPVPLPSADPMDESQSHNHIQQ